MSIDLPVPVLVTGILGVVGLLITGLLTLRGIIVRARADQSIARTQAQGARNGTFSEITDAWDKAMDRIEKLQGELDDLRKEFDTYRTDSDAQTQAQTVKLAAVGRVLLAIARQAGPRFRPQLDPIDVQLLEHEMPPEWIAEHLPDVSAEAS